MRPGSIEVDLADFGSRVTCQKTDVLSPAHLDLPAFAFPCKLFGADERPPAAVAVLLRDCLSSVPLVARVRRRESSIYVVDLIDTHTAVFDIRLADQLDISTPTMPASRPCLTTTSVAAVPATTVPVSQSQQPPSVTTIKHAVSLSESAASSKPVDMRSLSVAIETCCSSPCGLDHQATFSCSHLSSPLNAHGHLTC